jgi:hypothetical protein
MEFFVNTNTTKTYWTDLNLNFILEKMFFCPIVSIVSDNIPLQWNFVTTNITKTLTDLDTSNFIFRKMFVPFTVISS